MDLRISIHKNKFLRERSIKTDEIMQKYKNKARGLEKKQKAEREVYEIQLKRNYGKYININIK
ncbi:MAG: hypothetical protein MJ252_25825 [archaeon]|nr:hypothetical protein [archaeon]